MVERKTPHAELVKAGRRTAKKKRKAVYRPMHNKCGCGADIREEQKRKLEGKRVTEYKSRSLELDGGSGFSSTSLSTCAALKITGSKSKAIDDCFLLGHSLGFSSEHT
jgi:hypothetical protein